MSKTMKVAIVDDEKDMRQSISQWLALSGFDTETYASAEDALKGLDPDFAGIVVSDIRMPGMDGMQFLRKLKSVDRALPVIMITGHGDVPMAVEAMRIGAFDFLEKPFNPDRMTELAKKASIARRLTLDNRALRRELSDGSALMKKLIGSSDVMERLKEDILDLGQADGHVLIEGETGTGKTLVAHALHAVGARAAQKFVLLSCSAYDDETLGAKLFGPAGEDDTPPAIEEARGGTLVLEDIEALSHAMQSRLLMAINEQGTPAETRIVAICNLQDEGKTCESVLRPDLFYRLAALKITVPPLRAGRGYPRAVFASVRAIRRRIRLRGAGSVRAGGRPAVAGALARQRPPVDQRRRTRGPAKPTRNRHHRLAVDGRQRRAQVAMTTEGKPLKEFVEAFERMLIDNTMRRHRGSIVSVMDELQLPRRTLNEKMAKYNLQRSDYLG